MKRLLIISVIFLLSFSYVSAYNFYYYHNDHLGNPVAVTNEDGEVVWKAEYEPFGSIFNEEGDVINKYNYNTKELDKNTALLYYGARYYDPELGRFTTADTVKGRLSAPQSLNRYTYTLNNPMNFIDPSGNQELKAKEFIKFVISHPKIAMKYYGGAQLSIEERQTILNFAAKEFKGRYPDAYKYLFIFMHPKKLKNAPMTTYHADKPGTGREGKLYPLYDISKDLLKAGLNPEKVLAYAAENARNPTGIIEGYNRGDEAYILSARIDEVSSMSDYALGVTSFYIQKGGNGMAILRLKDRYDFFKDEQSWKSTCWKIQGDLSSLGLMGTEVVRGVSFASEVNVEGITYVGVTDFALEKLGEPYIMKGEWQVPEEAVHQYFGGNNK